MATRKQKAAAAKIIENRGNVSKTMLEVGYSPNTAKVPQNLTDSIGWKELMNDWLPDDKTLQRHEEIIISGEDRDAVKGIDMHYKLKGYYAPEKHVNLNLDANSTERTRELGNRLSGLFRRGNRTGV